MSANLDLVRSIYAAHERRDYSSVEWAHSDIGGAIALIADIPHPNADFVASARPCLRALQAGGRRFDSARGDLRTIVSLLARDVPSPDPSMNYRANERAHLLGRTLLGRRWWRR